MTDPTPAGAQPGNRTVMIVLSYLWLLALIPLLVEKDDREVQWHAKHGIVLMAAELILWVVLVTINMVVGSIPVLGCITGVIGALVGFILWVGILVVHVLAIVKGVNGQRLVLPYVSQYADRF